MNYRNFFAELKRQNDFNDTSVKKVSNEGLEPRKKLQIRRFSPVGLRKYQKGSKWGLGPGEITISGCRFGRKSAEYDPAAAGVPDPVGSAVANSS